jgi:signal transduction histidine kinase
LGLYITKSIIDAHLARIWIESVLGQGTTVLFTLLRADEAAPRRAAAAQLALGK